MRSSIGRSSSEMVSKTQKSFGDKTEKMEEKDIKPIPFSCMGTYCTIGGEAGLYDENDEAANLYLKNTNQDYLSKVEDEVSLKSILLDIIEREKTVQRIKNAFPNADPRRIENLPDSFLLKYRIYYSLGDLLEHQQFKHQKSSTLYKRVKVCNYCRAMYNKLDTLRKDSLSYLIENGIKRPNIEIPKSVEKAIATVSASSLSSEEERKKKKFSKEFFEQLSNFDEGPDIFSSKKPFKNFFKIRGVKKPKVQSNSKSRSPPRKLTGSGGATDDLAFGDRPSEFQLPNIFQLTLVDKDHSLERVKVQVDKTGGELLGLKHFLGHVENLPFSDNGLAISKSSYKLNKLQDKIKKVDEIQKKFDREKTDRFKEEIQMLVSPYKGKKKFDNRRLVDILKTIKPEEKDYYSHTDSSYSRDKPANIQVVTDKNEFLTESQRKLKSKKENEEKNRYIERKNFLENNSNLAQSVLQKEEKKPKISTAGFGKPSIVLITHLVDT